MSLIEYQEPWFANSISESPICRELFYSMRLSVPKGATVLELGSGPGSTSALRTVFDVRSVEHKQEFVGKYNSVDKYIHVPLLNGFYDMDKVLEKVDFKYEFLLVDGPDEESRQDNFHIQCDRFDKTVPWFFDDYGYNHAWQDRIKCTAIKTGKELLEFNAPKPYCVML